MLYETLSETLDAAEKTLSTVVINENWRDHFSGGINYNQCLDGHFPIESLNGHKTRKYFHVIITRLDSGRYELVSYIS